MMRSVKKFLNALKFTYFSLFTITLSAIILFTFMLDIVQKETYELKEFQIAHEAIRSLKTVEDTVKTEQERDRAANEVAPVYQFTEDVAKNRQAIATSIFDFLLDVKKELVADSAEEVEEVKIAEKSVEAMREKLAALEAEEPELQLSNKAIADLLAQDIETLEGIKTSVVSVLGEELSKPLRTSDLTFAKYEVERQLRLSNTIPVEIEEPVISIARSLLVETEIFNETLTASRVQEAREAVEPIRILQGQVIVREGQVIDREVYRQLELAGLLTNQTQVKPLAGIALFVSVMMSIFFLHFQTWRESSIVKKKSLVIALVVFLFPTALASMLIKLLVNERLALTTSIIIAATAGIMLQDGYAAIVQMEIALYILFGSITSLYLLGNISRRSTILRASLGVSICNLGFIAFYLLMTQTTYALTELIFYAIAAITSGVLSGALTIGLLPFFETSFGLLSDMKLIELSNPNHPLLKKILTEAPGTYHHSVMVANLADAACETIGANGLLARVGSYYHDLGKTVRPRFFIENQHAEQNPHDALPPKKSKDIIIAHAADGAQLLEKHKMPREIVDIARQHHGTSLLKFFVFKAKELGEDVIEDEYRYPGPKPQTKEIAIISIADSVEAAVRSMKEPTSEKINALVCSIVSDKLRDGQFDECDLSMKELKRVERAICETLNGMFHNRIEYPD
ncbi:HD family phosphohydrolase [Sporosarcina pasteurii]|uniref:Predicted HD superfamily hydrolase n=1 Tax=Sporosarcina pasteurii TaxID=1474 RepID=A0A380BNU9_SPOPA|nr:HDIG domain-containing metalloprotein [Sporosarcina pasteurii]QBQ05324.1 HDIG domain-containing protein [Sporosarcina pasteurii]SUJ04048.1 Predicted HD superfamily hydrolase [Sporosarcina pasteurii]